MHAFCSDSKQNDSCAEKKKFPFKIWSLWISPGKASLSLSTKVLGSRKDINENKFYAFVKKFKDAGATILGGCCEIGPSHISKIANLKN